MDQPTSAEALLHEALELLRHGRDNQDIKVELLKRNANPHDLEEVMKQVRLIRYRKQRKNGLVFLGIGSFLLVFGFILTAVMFHNNTPFKYVMYSMTTVGIVLILIGLANIMGF